MLNKTWKHLMPAIFLTIAVMRFAAADDRVTTPINAGHPADQATVSGAIIEQEGILFPLFVPSGAITAKSGVIHQIKFDVFDGIYEVMGLEKVVVPSGTYDAYKIRYMVLGNDKEIFKSYYWFEPEIGVIRVQFGYVQNNFDSGNQSKGTVEDLTVFELSDSGSSSLVFHRIDDIRQTVVSAQ